MITIYTKNSARLLAKHIYSALRESSIPEWIIDNENDMTLSSVLWRNKSWMRIVIPKASDNHLDISMIGSATSFITSDIYAIYHSKLIEMLLRNFDEEINSLTVSSALVSGVDQSMNSAFSQIKK